MSMGDDSDSDDDDDARSRPTKPPGIPQQPSTPLSKNAALAAAVSSSPNAHRHNPFANSDAPSPQQQRPQQPPAHAQQQSRNPFENPPMQQQRPMVLAAPQPGYAAPIAALNLGKLAASAGMPQPHPTGPSMPQPAMMRQPAPNMPLPMPPPVQPNRARPPQNLQINTSNPFELEPPPLSPFVMSNGRVATPSPHPLQPPITPITPAFIRPAKSIPAPAAISFDEAGLRREKQGSFDSFDEGPKAIPRKRIMRGDGEETLLPKRGEKGDDFWRRFSMVVKDSKGGKVER